jgi:pyrimidine operon attenuation protein/uracil phosphoribosyltransferase
MSDNRTLILDHRRIVLTLERIALEICARHHNGSDLVLGGIGDRGYLIATLLHGHLMRLHTGSVGLFRIDFNRSDFRPDAITYAPQSDFSGRQVIVADDVLNSGKTLMHVIQPIVAANPVSLETAFLAERSYRSFPVRADFTGISLATTIQEHVSFDAADPDNMALWLS